MLGRKDVFVAAAAAPSTATAVALRSHKGDLTSLVRCAVLSCLRSAAPVQFHRVVAHLAGLLAGTASRVLFVALDLALLTAPAASPTATMRFGGVSFGR